MSPEHHIPSFSAAASMDLQSPFGVYLRIVVVKGNTAAFSVDSETRFASTAMLNASSVNSRICMAVLFI